MSVFRLGLYLFHLAWNSATDKGSADYGKRLHGRHGLLAEGFAGSRVIGAGLDGWIKGPQIAPYGDADYAPPIVSLCAHLPQARAIRKTRASIICVICVISGPIEPAIRTRYDRFYSA
jgi:hypothetical protein